MKPDSRRQPTRRLHIKRIDLHLHGVAPNAAEAAAGLLGPALARALAGRRINEASAEQIDGGRINIAGGADAGTLSSQLAQRIAGKTSGD
jgi:hypothetical protein